MAQKRPNLGPEKEDHNSKKRRKQKSQKLVAVGQYLQLLKTQDDHHNLRIHIHGTATAVVGQHFKGELCDINPETVEYFIPDTENPEDGDKKTFNLEFWDSLPGSLGDPPSTNVEFQERARSCVAKALDNLCYTRTIIEKGEEVRSWKFKEDPDDTYSWFETELMEGFFYNMHNSRGRIAVHALLEKLFCVQENIKVHNIGGCSTRLEPCVREMVFTLKHDTDWLETLSSSSSSSSESYSCHSRPERTDELPVSSRLRPLPPGRPSPPKILPWHKCLVPDIVIEKKQGTQRQEVLVVSIKAGHKLNQKSITQIKYEMLPMLTKKDSALGLLMCASKAILFRFIVSDNKPCLKGKEYDFTTDEFVNEVVQMCCDLQYYMHLID